MIQKFAEENALNYVDYYSKMVDGNKGLKKIYGDDGVHPNKEGYKTMEQLLLKAIL